MALLSGANDLEGDIFPGQRSTKENVDAFDLSLEEMPLWISEIGLEALLRNGLYESKEFTVPPQSDRIER